MRKVITFILSLFCLGSCFMCSRQKNKIDYLGQKPPGLNAEIFAPDIISTAAYEHSAPAFSPDGKLVLWTVVDKNYRASMFEMKRENGSWSSPLRPSFADSTADDYYPSFAPDGKILYFSSRRKAPVNYPTSRDIRIWQVGLSESGWGEPIPFDTIVSIGIEYAHSISSNGTLYSSSPLGGGTQFNIQSAEKVNGIYSKAEILPFSINSIDYEDGPYIAPDERFLIFESSRPESIGGSIDLYISFRGPNGQWSLPVNMGPKINSPSAERFARLSPDGKYLFFGSSRTQSTDRTGFDIYWIDAKVIDELKNDSLSKVFIPQPLGNEIINALYKGEAEPSAKGLKDWLNFQPKGLDANLIYSSIQRQQKNYKAAEDILNQNLTTWGQLPNFLLELALIKFGLGQDSEAHKLVDPILIEGNQLRQRYMHLSNGLLDMKRFDLSEVYFNKAMAVHSIHYDHLRRARKYTAMSETDKAFEHLNQAIALGLNSKNEFEGDPDLESLKSDSRWEVLLQKLN